MKNFLIEKLLDMEVCQTIHPQRGPCTSKWATEGSYNTQRNFLHELTILMFKNEKQLFCFLRFCQGHDPYCYSILWISDTAS